MNIFILDYNPRKCVEYYTDKHITKMLLETTQLLQSVYYFTNEDSKAIYKLAHKNHPCSIWVRQSLSNWKWLYILGLCMYDEYMYRYNKEHKSGELLLTMSFPDLKDIGITKFAQAMDIKYKSNDVVEAYRHYYNLEKRHLFKWTGRNIPEWVIM